MDVWTYKDPETANLQEKFLHFYAQGNSPHEAADLAGVPYRRVLIWRYNDVDFDEKARAIQQYYHENPDLAKEIFLEHLGRTLNEHAAAEAGGFPIHQFRKWKESDRLFSDLWDEAVKEAVDAARQGVLEHAKSRGGLDGAILLNAYEPERFKANSKESYQPQHVEINFIMGENPKLKPRRLEPQSGQEITIDAEDN